LPVRYGSKSEILSMLGWTADMALDIL
jgi:hypothetical protein